MGSPAEQQAMQYAVGKFMEAGCDTAYILKMVYTDRANTTSGIAVGIKRGMSRRTIVVGGHIDSAGPEIPGADDDASGAATVMEVARALGKREMQSTYVFCCFGGEEQGLEGSKCFVHNFPDIGDVELMLQVDMANGQGMIDIDPDTHGASAPEWLVRATIEEFNGLGYKHLRYPTHSFSINYALASASGSDHEPFLDRGIPAIDFTTDVGKPIHTPRDNFENFDPSGLQRSGELILKLIERYDAGQPTRELEHYWLYLVGTTPIFVPIWGVWLLAGLAFAVTITGMLLAWRRRVPIEPAERSKWSGLKTVLFSVIIATFGWLSSDLIALIRGIRHPWLTSFEGFYVFAALAMIIGAWFAVRIAKTLRVSRAPFGLYLRAAIIMTVFIAILGYCNVKLMVEPSVSLLLIGLAILIPNPPLKLIFIALSPWCFLRLVFSEWDGLLYHAIAGQLPSSIGGGLAYNSAVILFFSIALLPFLFSCAALVRDSLGWIATAVRSWAFFICAVALFFLVGAYLMRIPAFNNLWYRDIKIDESYDFIKREKNIAIQSGEYLTGLRVNYGNADTLIDARSTLANIPIRDAFDTTWLDVKEHEEKTESGDRTDFNVQLTLNAKMRPYTVTLLYTMGGREIWNFETSFKFESEGKTKAIKWYSFPDTMLTVPIKFSVAGTDSVKEHIEVTFNQLASPVRVEGESIYVIPRTRYVGNWVYKR